MPRVILGAILFLGMAVAGAGVAEEPAPNFAAELIKINATLEKIATLLARQSDSADLDLLMKRVQLGQSQVVENERRLKEAESRREKQQDLKHQLEMQLEMNRSRAENTSDQRMSSEELETLTRTWEEELKKINRRIAAASAEIAEFQNRLAETVEDVRGWQVVLDRRLAGR